MNDNTPLVSVVIPNRDQGLFLAAAIDSALDDPYGHVEVIVVDDGSTDDSEAIVRRYGDRVRPLATEGRRGACRARNVGLAAATGRFVKFLDADDFLVPGALGAQVEWLQRHGTPATSVYGDALWVDEDGRPMGQPLEPAGGLTEAERMILHAPLTSAPLHPVEAVRRVGGFDERVPRGQEYDLHLRMWLAGSEFHHLPGIVYGYRQHDRGRISCRDGDEAVARGRFESQIRILSLARERFGDPLPADVRRAFARQFWRTGRRNAQQGVAGIAAECFALARSLDSSVREGSGAYRLMCAAVGPFAAERIVGCAKTLRDRLAGRRSAA